jgi:hypothetical protein
MASFVVVRMPRVRAAGLIATMALVGCTRERERPIASDPTPTTTIVPQHTLPKAPTAAEPIEVTARLVTGPPPSVAIEIRNVGAVDVELDDRLGIEFEQAGAWVSSRDIYDTIAPTCAGVTYGAPASPRPCQRVTSGSTLKPPPWLGWTCASQCIGICRGNAPKQKGRYRFFVTTCDDAGKQRFVSAPIDWPGALP